MLLDVETGMDKARSAAGETVTVNVALLPSLTVRVPGERVTSSLAGMVPSPVGDQPLGPSLFLACTWTS